MCHDAALPAPPVHRCSLAAAAACAAVAIAACRDTPPADRIRVSGYVEATEVRVAPRWAADCSILKVAEGDRVRAGDVVAQLDTADIALALQRASAERLAADAQLRLLLAGARDEDIARRKPSSRPPRRSWRRRSRNSTPPTATSGASRRFWPPIPAPRSRATTRPREGTWRAPRQGRRAARARVRRTVARLKPVPAARRSTGRAPGWPAPTRDRHARESPAGRDGRGARLGTVTQKLVDEGELLAPRTPIVVVANLDDVWANVYVDEPLVPRVTLGQAATLFTDAGGPASRAR